MRIQQLLAALASSAALLLSTAHVRADSTTAVQDFANQMGSWNVITSNAFSTDHHVHGTAAVGGTATLSGNSEVNSQGTIDTDALRVYGNLNLVGTNNKVIAGGATIVPSANLLIQNGKPNGNQGLITDKATGGTLTFNGNSNTSTHITTTAGDDFFTSRDAVMQSANSQLLLTPGALAPVGDSNGRLTFTSTTAGVSVFNWNIDDVTGIKEVDFKFATDSFIVVNILGDTTSSIWNATFNTLSGSSYLAQHVLWNLGVSSATFSGSEILGSILAPDTIIDSNKQLNGAIYAHTLNQHNQEIHYSSPGVPQNVPEEPTTLVLALAVMTMGVMAWARRFVTAK